MSMRGGIFSTSLGHKLVMSLTGLFLMLFLLVHMTMNATLMLNDVELFGRFWGEGELFNAGAHFMISNPLVRVMEPLLAAGFILHIVYATIITLRNRRFRPQGYAMQGGNRLTSWSSKNMYILGFLILAFLGVHLMNFFWAFRYGEMPTLVQDGVTMDDSYSVVAGLFKSSVLYCLLYIAAAILLGLHLSHGFWSAFQTVGWNNRKWIDRLRWVAIVYSVVVAGGFAVIPLYFMIIS